MGRYRVESQCQAGQLLPMTDLAYLSDGEIRTRSSREIFAGTRSILIGIPGAFTPVCTQVHLPKFVELAAKIKASGFDMIACVCSNDPWVLAAWAQMIDPERRIRFLSDGNLELGSRCGLVGEEVGLFLGMRLKRFSMTIAHGRIERISVEHSVLSVTCSSAEACMKD
jgi:2-Cys peroxiredoxin 5